MVTRQLAIRVEEDLRARFLAKAHDKGTTATKILLKAIASYMADEDESAKEQPLDSDTVIQDDITERITRLEKELGNCITKIERQSKRITQLEEQLDERITRSDTTASTGESHRRDLTSPAANLAPAAAEPTAATLDPDPEPTPPELAATPKSRGEPSKVPAGDSNSSNRPDNEPQLSESDDRPNETQITAEDIPNSGFGQRLTLSQVALLLGKKSLKNVSSHTVRRWGFERVGRGKTAWYRRLF